MILSKLRGYVDRGEIPGAAILVRKEGKVIAEGYFGHEDLKKQRPVDHETVYRLMSMTKPVTAVVVMRYVEKGLISLEDEVEKYLSDFKDLTVAERMLLPDEADDTGLYAKPEVLAVLKGIPARRGITVGQLLNHTGGIGQGPVGIGYGLEHSKKNDSLLKRIRVYTEAMCDFQPGENTGYSVFAGFDALGAVLEKISGKTLEEVYREELFSLLGTEEIFFELQENKGPHLCCMCDYREGKLTESADVLWPLIETIPGRRYCASAGLYSTLEAYGRFAQMLLQRGTWQGTQILKEETVEKMTHPTTTLEKNPGCQWGIGMLHFGSPKETGRYLSEHTYGWSGAYGTHFYNDPQNHMTVVLMLNRCDINGEFSYISREMEETVYKEVLG